MKKIETFLIGNEESFTLQSSLSLFLGLYQLQYLFISVKIFRVITLLLTTLTGYYYYYLPSLNPLYKLILQILFFQGFI